MSLDNSAAKYSLTGYLHQIIPEQDERNLPEVRKL